MRALLPFLVERLGASSQVRIETEPTLSGGGSSKENWAFQASWEEGGVRRSRALLLRREPQAGVVETAMRTEFALLRALASTPVPAPRVLWLDADGSWFERPAMLVERARGHASRAVLRETDPLRLGPQARLELARDLAAVLAQVHAVDVEAAGLREVLPHPGPDPALHELDRWQAELDAVELEPQPELRWAMLWLRRNLPAPATVRLVHGDVRPANVLVHDGRLELLLDWELSRLGDPADDLGWYTCSIYTREHTVPGAFTTDDFVQCYLDAGGVPVDPVRLHFWQVLSVVRLAVIALTGVRNAVDGTTTRPAAPPAGLARAALRDALAGT